MPDAMVTPETGCAVLTIDLAAVVANWRLLQAKIAPAACAAVVKADAYGLGAAQVAPALAHAGCRTFFVATLGEGIALRQALDGLSAMPRCAIFVLNGIPVAAGDAAGAQALIPVLSTLGQVDAWTGLARRLGRRLPVALHIDTGMSRLGFPEAEVAVLAAEPGRLDGLDLRCVMSHLTCADEPAHDHNPRQRAAFARLRAGLPVAPASLAASSGIFLGAPYWGDIARPGAALYGLAPTAGAANPMQPVVRLTAPILQVRQIDTGSTVGYGATHKASRPERIATIGVGYADGFHRSLSNCGIGYVSGRGVPLVGRVSMDLMTFDVTDLPETHAHVGDAIELIGPHHSVDAVAAEAGTIGYEILTSLGHRYRRVYLPAGQ